MRCLSQNSQIWSTEALGRCYADFYTPSALAVATQLVRQIPSEMSVGVIAGHLGGLLEQLRG